MANLAIKGHATRGKEVIEILEMLGASGSILEGTAAHSAYFINDAGTINFTHVNGLPENYRTFTLEEFLEKFPYKVGDKVILVRKNKEAIIDKITWCCDTVTYWLKYDGFIEGNWRAEQLQPYKEQEPMSIQETMKQITDIAENLIKIDIPKGYEFAGVDNQQVVFEKVKLQYPKSYEECCDVLELDDDERYINVNITNIETLENKKFEDFIRLIRCRDAYWKLAGDWKPDWEDNSYKKTYMLIRIVFRKVRMLPVTECSLSTPKKCEMPSMRTLRI